MDEGPKRVDDRIETRRALVKLLEYIEDECLRVGCLTAGRMVALSRTALESELAGHAAHYPGQCRWPRLN